MVSRSASVIAADVHADIPSSVAESMSFRDRFDRIVFDKASNTVETHTSDGSDLPVSTRDKYVGLTSPMTPASSRVRPACMRRFLSA